MSGLFDPDEGCVEMSLSNAAIGAVGGSIAGLFKSSFYMGPKITGAPIKTPIAPAQAAKVMGNMGIQYGALSALFTAGMCFTKTIRGKDDCINWMVGGFMSGAVLGLKRRTFHHIVFTGCCMSLVSAGCYFFGDALTNDFTDNRDRHAVLEKNVKFYKKSSHEEAKKETGSFY